MNIVHKEHSIGFDPITGTLTITGLLRRMSKDYEEICELLDHILLLAPPRLIVDIHGLKMINSSGLNTLSRFVLALRGKPGVSVTFHGSTEVVWHAKTLANMKHFLPAAQVVLR
jgi:hypothetical protein